MKKLFIAILPLLLLLPVTANAMVTEAGETYLLGSQETVEGNLYAAGATVQMSGVVEGDAAIAGGNVTVTGEIGEDLMVAGGTVLLLGNIGGDVRAAGGNVTVIGDIGGEIVAVGGMVNTSSDVVIQGDAFLSGGSIIIDGVIEGDVEVYGEEVEVRGKITGSVIGKMTKLTIAEGAEIGGNLAYESPSQAILGATSIIVGAIDFEQVKLTELAPPDVEGALRNARRMAAGVFAALAVVRYLALLFAGLILVFWFTRKSELLVSDTLSSFGNNLLIGSAVMLAGPIAMIILLLTGIGSVFAVLGLALLSVVVVIGSIYSGIVLGAWIRQLWTKSKKAPVDWKSALLGITLISLAATIPILGWLFKLVFVMAVVGSVCKLKYTSLKS